MRYFLDLKEDVNIKAIQAIHIFNFFLTPTIMHNERSLLLAETGNHSPVPTLLPSRVVPSPPC